MNIVAIIGSRAITDFDMSIIKVKPDTIITGGANGVDTLAIEYANKNSIPVIVIKPDYKKYGKAAPLIRNRRIISLANEVIAIWDGFSKGTEYTIKFAEKMLKPVTILMPIANETKC